MGAMLRPSIMVAVVFHGHNRACVCLGRQRQNAAATADEQEDRAVRRETAGQPHQARSWPALQQDANHTS